MTTPLSSWAEGTAKTTILQFVERVTDADGSEFVPPEGRIATFDNDGTLWCEQPLQTQFFFGRDQLQKMAAEDPGLKERQPYKAFLEHDIGAIKQLGKQAFFEVASAAHAGMTEDEFHVHARDWLVHAQNPAKGRRFVDLVYRPQLELMEHLRQNGFRVFIVSGGGIDLIRAFSEEVYGIARSQVVGSSVRTRMEVCNGKVDLLKLAELQSFDDREAKVQNIALHIGRRPIFAFGNSDGDLAMLRYALSGSGLRLALLLHHDDGEREFAYDREFAISPLAEALDRAEELGITVVSFKNDWRDVFAEQRSFREDELSAARPAIQR
ncbi:HAD family hydrolase (plasmid) [Novosphingobium sp. BL-8A]|uniref:HAD family hydrolase n=1 Tax=Novosphingobium sp. BL-8A TaxID=3127639 RepID=UPI003757F8CB